MTTKNTFPDLKFPLQLLFKLSTLASDFTVKDPSGNTVAYVRQKLLKLKEDVIIFKDESRNEELYRIRANQWIDFNATYSIFDQKSGNKIGELSRKGMRSLWKSMYHGKSEDGSIQFSLSEDNAWVKVIDSIVGEIPILGMFTGYIFNPSYSARIGADAAASPIYQLKKKPSFFGRKFELARTSDRPNEEETIILLSFMMMVLLERARG